MERERTIPPSQQIARLLVQDTPEPSRTQARPVSVQIGEAAYFGSYEIQGRVLAVTYGRRRECKTLQGDALDAPFREARKVLRDLVKNP